MRITPQGGPEASASLASPYTHYWTQIFYSFFNYFLGQHCCWTVASITGKDLFVFHKFPSPLTFYCHTPALPMSGVRATHAGKLGSILCRTVLGACPALCSELIVGCKGTARVAAMDSPPVQNSLQKQLRGPRRKQAYDGRCITIVTLRKEYWKEYNKIEVSTHCKCAMLYATFYSPPILRHLSLEMRGCN